MWHLGGGGDSIGTMSGAPLTRRFYRRAFRRVRIYLPLTAVLFLSLVLFLPISGGWLGRIAEREILKALGVPVEIDRLNVTVASAVVNAYGVGVEDTGFRVGRVELDGRMSGLLAGGEEWPDRVTIDKIPDLKLKRGEDGRFHLEGPFQELAGTIANLSRAPETEKATAREPSTSSGRIGRTPRVVIREFPVEIEGLIPAAPRLQVSFDRIDIRERATRLSPYHVELRGQLVSNTVEKFLLTADVMPNRQRLDMVGEISGLSLPFAIPGLGEFETSASDIHLEVDAGIDRDGIVEGRLSAKAGVFQLERLRTGGERWRDEALDLSIRFRYDPATMTIEVRQFSARGQELDIAADGTITARGEYPGDVGLQVRRLPLAAMALGQGELEDRFRLRVNQAVSSPTLRLDVNARGPFADPALLEGDVTLRLDGWSIAHPTLPETLRINHLDLVASPAGVELRRMDLGIGGLELEATGKLPIVREGAVPKSELSLRAVGDAEVAFDVLSRQGLMPSEITFFRAPINLETTAQVYVEARDGAAARLRLEDSSARMVLGWRGGELGLRMLYEPIQLEPGAVRFEPNLLTLQRLSAFIGGVQVNATGDIAGDLLNGDPTSWSFRGDVISSGAIEKVIYLVTRFASIPEPVREIGGNFQLELAVRGDINDAAALDYRARLLVDGARATVDYPPHLYRLVPLEEISIDAVLDRETFQIRRASLRIPDEEFGNSSIEFSATANAERIRIDASARTHLEYMTALVAKELKDVYMEGLLPAEGYATLTPQRPLPEGPDLLRRWIAYFSAAEPPVVHIRPEKADLLVDYRFDYLPGTPVTVIPRDFPVPMNNLRGNAYITPEGLHMVEVRGDIGSARDVRANGLIQFGRPTRIQFDADTDYININEWMSGWKEQPWATPPISVAPGWRSVPEPRPLVEINSTIKARKVDFLTFTGGPVSTDFHFEAWSRTPPKLRLENMRLEAYDGSGDANIFLEFPRGERPWMRANADIAGVSLDPFLDDLKERDQRLDGSMTGTLEFYGQILNYPTYTGNGEFDIVQSSALGTIVFAYAKEFIELASRTGGRDSEMSGIVSMANEEIHFEQLDITHPKINMAAEGYIDFRGRLFFDVWASVLGKQLRRIPIVGNFVNPLELITEQMLAYRVRGKLGEPEYYPIPSILTRIEGLRSGRVGEENAPLPEVEP